MKVLMYSHSFGLPTTTFIYNQIKYLHQNGCEVHYLCNYYFENDFENFCTIHHVPLNESVIWKKIKWILWKKDIKLIEKNRFFKRKLIELLDKVQPDIIHCHFVYEGIRLYQNLPNNFSHPLIFHVHGYGGSQMLKKHSYVKELKKILEKPNCWVILVSNLLKSRFRKLNLNLSRSKMIYCGISLEDFYFKNKKRTKNQFTFLQVSSLTEKKGHIFSINAFKKFLTFVKDPSIYKYVFTGYTDEFKHIKDLIFDLKLEKNVHVLGVQTNNQVYQLLQEANVFVHHSITPQNGDEEGIPTSIMEAMLMKLPILTTYHAGIPELVKHGENGLLCKEKDVNTLSSQMLEITKWRKLDLSREKIINEFSLTKHGQMVYSLYESIISN